jgi:probable blue pigment (indigoidine) exporter
MPSPRRPVLALILAAASWGFGTVISKRAVDEVPALTLLVIQLSASLVAIALFMRLRRLPLRSGTSPHLRRLGLLNPGLAYALSLLGLVQITASLSVLLWAAEPLLILLLASLFLRERLGPTVVVLFLVATAGMTLVLYGPGTGGELLGVALTLAGVACCAVYTVASRRWLAESDATASVVAGQQAYALAFALVLASGAALLGGAIWATGLSAAGLVSAVVSGVLYYGVAYGFYLTALRQMPASSASASFYLIPVFGVAGGVLALGEHLSPAQWIGGAIVLVAVAAILRASSAEVWTADRDGTAEAGENPRASPEFATAEGDR